MGLLLLILDWLKCFFSLPSILSTQKYEIPKRDKREKNGIYETVFADEIDLINENKMRGMMDKYEKGENLFPNCDVAIWLRDCKQEVLQPISGRKIGEIPLWLNGSLLRNGPGSLSVGEEKFKHIFDGSALLHRFSIKNGEASYQCRFLRSSTYERNHAAQRIVVSEFGTAKVPDPCMTIFERFASMFKMDTSDNCMISIYPFKDELYTLSETPVMYKIDEKTLETIGSADIKKHLNIVHHTAHPIVLDCGTVFNLGMATSPTGPKYGIFVFPNTKKEKPSGVDVFSEAKIVATVKPRWPANPSYMHSFGMTENYFIIVEQPLSIVLFKNFVVDKIKNNPLSACLKFYKDYPTLIHVVSRSTGKHVFEFKAEPFFYLHVINQYEHDGHIVIDICAYKDASMINCMLVEALKEAPKNPNYAKMFRGRPIRFVLPLKSHKSNGNLVTLKNTKAGAYRTKEGVYVTPEILCKIGCETPRINEKFMGTKYRYFYAISSDVDLENPGTLIKVDVRTKEYKTWCESRVFPCEPIFVAKPDSNEEDDGIILSSLLWTDTQNKVGLLALDAKTFKEIGRVVFDTPGPIPKCLHGWFVNKNE